MSRENLEQALGYAMRDAALLETALTHASYGHEHGSPDNERLEFLGDAVLELIATQHLYESYPDVEEGHLSRVRSQLVRRETLADWARGLQLGACLRLGAGAQSSHIRTHDRALANVFEAVLGAVYLDGGFSAAKGVVGPLIEAHLQGAEDDLEKFAKNPVSELQEWAQRSGLALPEYTSQRHEDCTLAGHEWEVAVEVKGLPPQKAVGATKSMARRRAAGMMLEATGSLPGSETEA